MKSMRMILVSLGLAVAAMLVIGSGNSDIDKTVAIRDDCDPNDPNWNRTGGCSRQQGDVTEFEFAEELFSPLVGTVPVGHQAWRNDPSYLQIGGGESVHVSNRGGRVHTFTKVAEFGGGLISPLNGTMTVAPECATAANLAPGDKATVDGLGAGNHRFQCCIHPWMRALVKVDAQK